MRIPDRLRKIRYLILAVVGIFFVTTAESCSSSSGTDKEETTANSQLEQYLKSQPIPRFNSSQLRQNLIEIQTAQANATVTTSFMFLLSGSGSTGPLVHQCSSIGFPIPATYQLTNPESDKHEVTLPQLESTGVYTGDTTGTYVICIGADGEPFAFYHEGFVATVTGPAHWDNTKGEIVMDGPSSAEFTGAG